jgi:hypothetical protein
MSNNDVKQRRKPKPNHFHYITALHMNILYCIFLHQSVLYTKCRILKESKMTHHTLSYYYFYSNRITTTCHISSYYNIKVKSIIKIDNTIIFHLLWYINHTWSIIYFYKQLFITFYLSELLIYYFIVNYIDQKSRPNLANRTPHKTIHIRLPLLLAICP